MTIASVLFERRLSLVQMMLSDDERGQWEKLRLKIRVWLGSGYSWGPGVVSGPRFSVKIRGSERGKVSGNRFESIQRSIRSRDNMS